MQQAKKRKDAETMYGAAMRHKVLPDGSVAYIDADCEIQVVSNAEEFDKVRQAHEKKVELERFLTNTKFDIEVGNTRYYVPLKNHDRIIELISLFKHPNEQAYHAKRYFEMKKGAPY